MAGQLYRAGRAGEEIYPKAGPAGSPNRPMVLLRLQQSGCVPVLLQGSPMDEGFGEKRKGLCHVVLPLLGSPDVLQSVGRSVGLRGAGYPGRAGLPMDLAASGKVAGAFW